MTKRGVWRKISRSEIPDGRTCVKSKWVFDIKRSGRFRARIVACGYSQIPGVDFTKNYSPVVNDVTYQIMIIAMIIWSMNGKLVDVETAFLYGDLDEEIFMECPDGMRSSRNECLRLNKSIYGLVQAARSWNKKIVEILKKKGFKGGMADPCLWTRTTEKGTVFLGIYVDDNLIVGNESAIKEAIESLKEEGLILKVDDSLNDYLSCEILFSENKDMAWIGQPHLIKKMEEKFGHLYGDLQTYMMPGTPGFRVIRPKDGEDMIGKHDQKLNRSGVGMLLFLVKHLRPDIANSVRELSKVLDGAHPAAFKEMLRVMRYVSDTKDLGLKIQPNKNEDEMWDIVVYTDSDYAGDEDTRISVSGFVIYVMGVPVCWKSKAQNHVTLSSSEAEFVALSEAAKEIKFVVQILESMDIKVKKPVIVRVDNNGAIFMSENVAATGKTKHMDIRYHFVREFVEDGLIKIVFVKTKENDADVFTKNLGSDLHSKHSSKMITWKDDVVNTDKD